VPTSPLYTAHNKCSMTAYYVFHVQPEDGHCQMLKPVVVPYVVDYLHIFTIK